MSFLLVLLEVCNFIDLFKETALCFIDLFYSGWLFVFNFMKFCSYLYYFLPSVCFGFIAPHFSPRLRWELWLHSFKAISFPMYTFSAIHFPLSIALAMPHKFWYVLFSLHSMYFYISLVTSSLTYRLFRSVLFSFWMFGNFPVTNF